MDVRVPCLGVPLNLATRNAKGLPLLAARQPLQFPLPGFRESHGAPNLT